MKQLLYKGFNDEFVMFALTYVDVMGPNADKAKEVFLWHLEKSRLLNTHAGELLVNEMCLKHIETTSVMIDGESLWKNTYIVHYQLRPADIQNCASGFSSHLDRYIMPRTRGEHIFPYYAACKIITGKCKSIGRPCCREDISDRKMNDWFFEHTKESGVHNNLIIGISATNGRSKFLSSYEGWYSECSKFEIEVCLYDNIASSINDSRYWLYSTYINLAKDTRIVDKGSYNNQLHAVLYNQTLIIYDNEKSYNSIKDKMNDALINRYDTIILNHYGVLASKRNIYRLITSSYGYEMRGTNESRNSLTLMMISRDRIKNPTLRRGTSHFDGTVSLFSKNNKSMGQAMFMIHSTVTYGEINFYIIPYAVNETIHEKATEILSQWVSTGSSELRNQLKEQYVNECLSEPSEVTDDAMSEWFKACTQNAANDEERLKLAYLDLKANLLKEYKDIGAFLATQSFNNKQPIPAIKLGEGLDRSTNGKIAFDLYSKIYNEMHGIPLPQAVTIKELRVKFFIPGDRRTDNWFNGVVPFEELYNKQTNELVLQEIDMIKKAVGRMR